VNNIKCPQLVVDRNKAQENIRRMAEKAKKHGVTFRPHFKTHQSAEVGEMFRQEGVECITVSSVQMAEYFADHGWSDITIAFPVNLREIDEINSLNKRVALHLLVESVETVQFLNDHLEKEADVYLKIDTGYHRTGIDYRNTAKLEEVLEEIAGAPKVRLSGLLAHNGHTYHAGGVDEILSIHESSMEALRQLRQNVEKYQPGIRISLGDTPSCSLADDFEGVDEIRPGNFVFYDLQQEQIGSCSFDQIAVIVACPVVAVHEKEEKIIAYGGGVHLSKQGLEVDGRTIHGRLVELADSGWGDAVADTYVASVSQEHGVIHCGNSELLSRVKPGDLLGVVPVHACLAVNLLSDIHFV
jgi:D-serine deaminase-like pyridoxal phosphate-dependent protein